MMKTVELTKEQLVRELVATREKLAQVTAAARSVAAGQAPVPGSKPALRSAALRRRDAVDMETRTDLAMRLMEVGSDLVSAFMAAHGQAVVSLYSVIGSEPDIAPLAQALSAAGVPLALPVDWSHGGPLIYRRWTPGDRLAVGPMGIGEPLPDAPLCEPDLVFVPLVAFDRRGCRIGYGAGNVDRTLAQLRATKFVRVIGVAFANLEERDIPVEATDQTVDAIVTERETITVKPLA